MGKTKKFPAERFLAICDFIMALNCDGCREHKNWNRSVDYLACVSIFANVSYPIIDKFTSWGGTYKENYDEEGWGTPVRGIGADMLQVQLWLEFLRRCRRKDWL